MVTGTGADPRALLAMATGATLPLREVDRDRAAAEDALAALRRSSDPSRLHLDPGLLAEVDALVDGWRGIDRLLVETAEAVRSSDLLGAIQLRLAGARARAAVTRGVGAHHLLGELRYAAAGSPAVVAGWFARLSPAELALLEAHGGARLGRLDGVPLAVRDRVNRRLVAGELERLRAEVDADGWVQRNLGLPFVADGWSDAHEADLARIHSLEQLLEADLVLAFDPAGDGRAVAAYGDPDAADHVATIVPGISNHLGNLGDTLRSARFLRDAARDRRDGTVATIAWLGYDTPGSLGNHTHELVTEATHGERARDAARDLTRFLAGLDATRAAAGSAASDPAHVSVIGHSYGSRVLGEALTIGDIEVAEAVAVGAPGMGVDHVGEWDLPDGTVVWAESAGTPSAGWWLPGGGDDPVAHVPLHGRNPDDPAFGARGFDVTGASGHSDYFARGTSDGEPPMSLRSLAAIVAGQTPAPDTDRVALELAPGPLGEPPTGEAA